MINPKGRLLACLSPPLLKGQNERQPKMYKYCGYVTKLPVTLSSSLACDRFTRVRFCGGGGGRWDTFSVWCINTLPSRSFGSQLAPMLLQYASLDLLNSSITDVHSGVHLFSVITEAFFTTEPVHHPGAGTKHTRIQRRRTAIADIHQRQVAEIVWAGRVPLSIRIHRETLSGVTSLFNNCETVTVM
jgi:hypothetical protein